LPAVPEPTAFRAFVTGFVAISVLGIYGKWTQAQGIEQNAASIGFFVVAIICFVIPSAIFVIGYKNLAPRLPRMLNRSWWFEFSDGAVRFFTLAAGALAGILLQRAMQ
jgi:hypothetical protein